MNQPAWYWQNAIAPVQLLLISIWRLNVSLFLGMLYAVSDEYLVLWCSIKNSDRALDAASAWAINYCSTLLRSRGPPREKELMYGPRLHSKVEQQLMAQADVVAGGKFQSF